jgi:hypothetical protein
MAFKRAVLRRTSLTAVALALAFGAVSVSGCASRGGASGTFQSQEPGSSGALAMFRRQSNSANAAGQVIGVNAYLWRASLDTLSFMPLASADPYGGLINTEWYANPEKPDERFKATVYILDTRLRADGVNVAIHRQTRNGAEWVDAPTAPDTEDAIEDAILTKARQLRLGGR